jgi:hypothetical protein
MKTFIIILLLAGTLFAQERVLLRIGQDGQQEAIPLRPGERTQDAIERLESIRFQRSQYPANTAGLVDTVRYYQSESELTTNFGFTHQDVAMQWYKSIADGEVLEFWWKNLTYGGTIRMGTVRAWYIDPRLEKFPPTPNTKYIGTYKDANDGDGGVTPFKPSDGNTWFYCSGVSESTDVYCGDPFRAETPWIRGGVQVYLDSNKWQGIKLADYSDSLTIRRDSYFGFTLSNDTKLSDIGTGTDQRMELATAPNVGLNPFHSYKFYETGRTAPANAGWHMRGDYDWGFYVVIAYTSCRPPKLVWSDLWTTTSTAARKLCITASGFSCVNPADTNFILKFYYKIGRNSSYDSTVYNAKDGTYCFQLPGANRLDTVFYYAAVQTTGSLTMTPVRSYYIFKPINKKLIIHNNARFSAANAKLIYTGSFTAPGYDYWSAPADGTGELPDLFMFYDNILVADGSEPSRNVYPALKEWLATGTKEKPKRLFLTSQDYGCYIGTTCSDTVFSSGSWEFDYLGIEKLGPQNLPPFDREHRIHPMQDTVTNYLIRFEKDSNLTLWSDPTYELGFAGSMDAMQPRVDAKVLFREGKDSLPVGLIFRTENFTTMFTGFDIGTLQFIIDTSMEGHWRYKWINDVKSVSAAFFESLITDVSHQDSHHPIQYSLSQNYPNPFNPSTVIEYSVREKALVTISIYNVLGQKITTVVSESKDPGSYRAEWNASHMASGLYFYEMRANDFMSVKKMLVLK